MLLSKKKSSKEAPLVSSFANAGSVLDFDIRGQLCPSTLLTALKTVNESRAGLKDGTAILRFKTDNRDATTTIPDALENMGYEVKVSKEKDHYVIEITAPVRAGEVNR